MAHIEFERQAFLYYTYVMPPQSWGDQGDTKHSNASS